MADQQEEAGGQNPQEDEIEHDIISSILERLDKIEAILRKLDGVSVRDAIHATPVKVYVTPLEGIKTGLAGPEQPPPF